MDYRRLGFEDNTEVMQDLNEEDLENHGDQEQNFPINDNAYNPDIDRSPGNEIIPAEHVPPNDQG